MFPLLLLPFIFSLSYSCPNGTFSSSLNTSICYTVLEGAAGKHSWYDGEALCQVQFNGHLASIPNAFLNNFLNGYLDATQSKTLYWIGGTTTIASNASWTWTDGTPFTYTNWEWGNFLEVFVKNTPNLGLTNESLLSRSQKKEPENGPIAKILTSLNPSQNRA